jgi:putative addiction module component (TIGR02574 family)
VIATSLPHGAAKTRRRAIASLLPNPLATTSTWVTLEFVTKAAIDLEGLTRDQKLALIDEIWASLDDQDLELTPAQQAELDERLARLERDGPVGTTWEAVRAEMSGTQR